MSEEERYLIAFLQMGSKINVNEVKLKKEDIKILANYIDKLQKENEELKEDNKVLCEMTFIRPMPFLYTTPAFTSTDAYVSKDKVKDVVNNFIEKLNDLLGGEFDE